MVKGFGAYGLRIYDLADLVVPNNASGRFRGSVGLGLTVGFANVGCRTRRIQGLKLEFG